MLEPKRRDAGEYICELCLLSEDAGNVQDVADLLAERIVKTRCPHAEAELWRATREGTHSLVADERERLLAYLEPDFGRPEAEPTEGDDDRVEGAVAEFLWYEIVGPQIHEGRELVRIEPPSFAVTDPGGDGLVVYRTAAGRLCFRLWEIKKHTGEGDVRDTATGAHRQLNRRALSYLARYSAVGQQLSEEDPDLAKFYARLVDLWQRQGEEAGAGVAVATSAAQVRGDVFDGLPGRFPALATGEQLEGLLSGIAEFREFSELVKEAIWSGL